MFLLGSKQKRFIVSFLLVFQIFLIPREAQANAAAMLALDTGIMSGIGETATAAVSVAAPYAVPIIVGAIACGVIYKNRKQIINFTQGALSYLQSVGQGVGKGIIDMGHGMSVMTAEAKTALNDYIQSYEDTASTVSVPLVETVSIPADTIVWQDLYVPVNKSVNINIEMLQTGTKHIQNLRFRYSVDNYTKTYIGSGPSDYIKWDVNSDCLRVGRNIVSLPTMGNVRVGIENVGSFQTEVGIVQTFNPDSSICADVSPTYQDSDFASSNSIKVAPISTSMTYDDFIGLTNTGLRERVNVGDVSVSVPFPDTGENTGENTGDITAPLDPTFTGSLWDWLQKIIDAINSIPELLQEILDWFKIDWAEVVDHIDYADTVREHFKPFYDITDLLTDIKANPQSHDGKFYMKIPKEMGGDDQEHCVLDLSVGTIYITTGRNIIKYGIWIAFLWFVLKTFSPRFNIT